MTVSEARKSHFIEKSHLLQGFDVTTIKLTKTHSMAQTSIHCSAGEIPAFPSPSPKSRVDMIWILCGHLRPQHQRPRVISFGHYVATFGLTPTCRGVVIWTLCVATFCLPEVSRGMTLRHPGEVYPIEMDAARHNPSTSPRGIDHRNHGAHACNSQATSP